MSEKTKDVIVIAFFLLTMACIFILMGLDIVTEGGAL